jgi:hypothetical protein
VGTWLGMSRNETIVEAPVEAAWAVLADADAYEDFVVGTKRIRGHDPEWPRPGAALYHSVGAGPFVLRDRSRVLSADPNRCLRIQVGVRPAGEAEVVFTLAPESPTRTRVTIEERPTRGVIKRIWNPLLDRMTQGRNAELLRRFSNIVEERAQQAIGQFTTG